MLKIALRLAIVVLVVGAVLLMAGCEGRTDPAAKPVEPAAEAQEMPAKAAEVLAEVEIAQKSCPVMGGAINREYFTDYEGRRVYFCCPQCIDEFKKDPEKYLAKLDEEIKNAR